MDRAMLFEQIRKMPVTDFFAEHSGNRFVPTNVTELIKNQNKIDIMAYLKCDKKYRDGHASDFEFFAEWERIFPLCAGNGEEKIYEEELRLVGLPLPSNAQNEEEACCRWRRANEFLRNAPILPKTEKNPSFNLVRFVSKFVISCQGYKRKLSDLAEEAEKAIISFQSKEIQVVFSLFDMKYQRTDPYHAEGALERMICDKKLYSENLFLVSAQLLILLLKSETEKRFSLHLYAEPTSNTPSLLISYLRDQRLFAGEAFVGVFADQAPETLRAIAAASDEMVCVHPELLLRHKDCTATLPEQMKRLFAGYPVGGITFGGALTDSACPEILHGIFKEALADCLDGICREEEQAITLARKMLKNKIF